jgi:hypothetical protein
MFDSNPGFYPMMGIPSDFNPYGEQRPTQSVSDSVIDSHFSFHPSDTFHKIGSENKGKNQ